MSEENKEDIFDDFEDKPKSAADKAKEKASQMKEEAKEAFEGAKEKASDMAGEAKEAAKGFTEEAKEAFEGAKEKASDMAGEAKEAAKDFTEDAKETMNDMKESWNDSTNNGENKKLVAGILAILVGSLGIHKFILGYTKEGIIQIILTFVTCGFASIIGLIEGIIYLTKSDEEFYQTYQVNKKGWF
jgi:TM2 domain-containing membrane protein YozV